MEQSQQRPWLWLYSFIISCLWLCGVSYVLCLLHNLLQCCLALFFSSACPVVFSLKELCLSKDLGFCSISYPVHICTELWHSLSGLVHSGIACLASQAPDWAVALWDGPVWSVIGYPLLGVHPSMSIVRLVMIGYHCNCLDGQLNFEHLHINLWVGLLTTDCAISNCGIAHSSNSFRMVSGQQ